MAVFGGKFERVVLVVSTGRTGTTALAQCFDAAFDRVCALHEPAPSRSLRVASNRHLAGRLPENRLIALYANARRRRFQRIREPVYVESNPALHGFLDVFDALFDAPRVVHVVRDPRTQIPSGINYGSYSGVKGLAVQFFPFWALKPEHLHPRPPRRWRDMSPAERIAWRWRTVNGELERGEVLFGGRYTRVRFEDLFAEGGKGMRGLAEWIGLDTNETFERQWVQKVNASTGARMPGWDEWPARDRQVVLDLCAPLMERYGYRTE